MPITRMNEWKNILDYNDGDGDDSDDGDGDVHWDSMGICTVVKICTQPNLLCPSKCKWKCKLICNPHLLRFTYILLYVL